MNIGKRIVDIPDDVNKRLLLYKTKHGTANISESIIKIVVQMIDINGDERLREMPWWCSECPQNEIDEEEEEK